MAELETDSLRGREAEAMQAFIGGFEEVDAPALGEEGGFSQVAFRRALAVRAGRRVPQLPRGALGLGELATAIVTERTAKIELQARWVQLAAALVKLATAPSVCSSSVS